MATVYAPNKTHGAVKITDRNGKYAIYRLHEVQVPLSSSSNLKRPKWLCESEPFETWTYKPYEANDVTMMPDTLLPFVKTWANCKVHTVMYAGTIGTTVHTVSSSGAIIR